MGSRRIVATLALAAVFIGLALCWGRVAPLGPDAPPGRARRAPAALAAPPALQAVDCEVAGELGGDIVLIEHDPTSLEALGPLPLDRHGSWLRFTPRHDEGLGMLTVPGHERVGIAWLEGACITAYTLTKQPSGRVEGTVSGLAPDIDYFVAACHSGASVEPDGRFVLEPVPGPCVLYVMAVVGATLHRGPEVAIDVPLGGVREVALVAPEIPLEPGWDLQEREYGFYVSGLLPGRSAALAGLEVGDHILQVDGEPAAELSAESLVTEADFPVALVIDRDGDVRDVVLRAP